MASPRPIPAQEPTPEGFNYKKAYEDYLFKLDTYRKAYKEYSDTRDFYLQTKSLGLKEDARLKTQAMLVARDDLLSVYMITLRMKLIDVPDHPGQEKGDILTEILPEAKWYSDHKGVYNKDNDSLETLFTKSEETTKHYDQFGDRVVYKTLARIAFSKFIDMKIEHEVLYTYAKNRLSSVEGNKKVLYDRWVSDIDKKFQNITDIQNQVQVKLSDFVKKPETKPVNVYENCVGMLVSEEPDFVALNGFLTEMLNAQK